jgi:hypothetical protein
MALEIKLTCGAKTVALVLAPVMAVLLYMVATHLLIDLIGERQWEVILRPRDERKFVSDAWLAATIQDGGRYPMANWLIKRRLLHGKAPEEVLKALGPPSARLVDGGLMCWDYRLAWQGRYPARFIFPPWELSNMDYWYLRIWFQNDRVVRTDLIVK